jgi:hypothetical protein
MSTVFDLPTLEELAGWPYDENDNPPLITESDVHFDDEIAAADVIAEEWWENQRLEARAEWLCFNTPLVGVS